jgi:hypothetical protein
MLYKFLNFFFFFFFSLREISTHMCKPNRRNSGRGRARGCAPKDWPSGC